MYLKNYMGMTKNKIFVVGDKTHVAKWIADSMLVDDIGSANIVLFTGGADITPKIYGGMEQDDHTHDIDRDNFEIETFRKVREDQICVGVCRGGQLLNVLNGGKMIQDCTEHKDSYHYVKRCFFNPFFKRMLLTNSRHHQMMYPYNLSQKKYKILYKTEINFSKYYTFEGDIDPKFVEPEIVLFKNENMPTCLCIQFHPEDITEFKPLMRNLNRMLNIVKIPFLRKLIFDV